jgi:hypothetical protein
LSSNPNYLKKRKKEKKKKRKKKEEEVIKLQISYMTLKDVLKPY